MKLLSSGDPFSVLKVSMHEFQFKKIEEVWEVDIEALEALLAQCARQARAEGNRGNLLVVERCRKFVAKRARYARLYREHIIKAMRREMENQPKKFELTTTDRRFLRSLRIEADEKPKKEVDNSTGDDQC